MNPVLASSQSIPNSQVESCKATVFKVGDYWLALPATAILKVISRSAFSGEVDEKLMLWNGQPLVRLNLHHLLSRSSISRPSEDKLNSQKYVLIVWSPTGDRCAILADELPTLVEIPLPNVQLLPPHYRQTISSIAKYMIALPCKGTVLTILLLDLQQALHKHR